MHVKGLADGAQYSFSDIDSDDDVRTVKRKIKRKTGLKKIRLVTPDKKLLHKNGRLRDHNVGRGGVLFFEPKRNQHKRGQGGNKQNRKDSDSSSSSSDSD